MNHQNRIKHQFENVMRREQQTITDYYTGAEYKVFFRTKSLSTDTEESLRLYYPEDTAIDNGTIFRYKNEIYLVINRQADQSNIFYTSVAQKCTQTIISNGATIPCVTGNVEITTSGNQVITVIDGTVILYTGVNSNYKKLSIGANINVMGNTYEITNKYTDNGLGYLKLEQTTSTPDVYALTYTGVDTVSMDDGTYQLTFEAMLNNSAVSDAVLTYVSSDETVATVDTNGLMTLVNSGTVVITASWEGVSANITITISQAPPSITCDITYTGDPAIIVGGNYKTFTGVFYDNNVDVTATITPVWSTTSDDFDVSLLQISNTTPNKYKIMIADTYENLIGKSFTLTLRDANNLCTKSIKVSISAYM